MKNRIKITRVIESVGSELRLTLQRVDDETIEIVRWKRKPRTADRFSSSREEEGRQHPISKLGLGVETWDELIAKYRG